MSDNTQLHLNLGCSTQRIDGFIGVDRWVPPWANHENFVQTDLRMTWPWDDSSVDHIRAHDIIEHLPDKIFTMRELHRVLKPGGTVEIVVPTTDGRGADQDPTHCSYWNRNSFFYYTAGNPHYERFKDAYGIRGGFVVLNEKTEKLIDEVTKLTITLAAYKDVGVSGGTGVEMYDQRTVTADAVEPITVQSAQPVFSILHATAHRLPFGWIDAWRAWSKNATHPALCEYILAVHSSDMEKAREGAESLGEENGIAIKVIAQDDRYCAVDNWNAAAKISTGKVLIMGADDFFPHENWDGNLATAVSDLDTEFVLHVSTGSERDNELIVHPIMSRKLYERWGYFLYPAYEGVFCDDDITAHAKFDDVVVDARHVVFDHRNPILAGAGLDGLDEGYKAQNHPERYRIGQQIYTARVNSRFGDVTVRNKKTIVLCYPGEIFSSSWVLHLCQLLLNLPNWFNVIPINCYSSNVYDTRNVLGKAALQQNTPPADYVLWIDDDNLVTPQQVIQLIQDLEENPEYDMVAGWCWIQPDSVTIPAKTSCGIFHEDGSCQSISRESMLSADPEIPQLIEIEWTGFPIVMMRRECLIKAGSNPFYPLPTKHAEHGFSGEDVAFCRLAKERGGARFAVDRRIKVPHLKLRSAEPNDLLAVHKDLAELTT